MIPDPYNRHQEGADALEEGFFLIHRDRASRVDIPVKIWFGAPTDPVTNELLDRSHRWQIMVGTTLLEDDEPMRIGGLWIRDIADLWPACGRHRIDELEYDYRLARHDWAAEYDPTDPHGEIGGRIDPMTCALP